MAPVLLPVLLLVAAMVVVIIVAGPPYSLRALLNDVPGPAGDMGWGMLATAILRSQLLLWLKIAITVVAVGAVAVVLEVVSERVAGRRLVPLSPQRVLLFGRSLPVLVAGIYIPLLILVGLGVGIRDAPAVLSVLLSVIPLIVFQSALLVWIMRPPPSAAPSPTDVRHRESGRLANPWTDAL